MLGNQFFRTASPNLKFPFNPLCLPRTLSIAAVVLAATLPGMAADSIATNSPNGAPLSTARRRLHHRRQARHRRKTLDATETLTYKNLTGQPLDELSLPPLPQRLPARVHLLLRDPRQRRHPRPRRTHYPPEKIGSIDHLPIDADGYGDLTSRAPSSRPMTATPHDHTVAEIKLPRPLAPNDSITSTSPSTTSSRLSVARNGYKRDFIMGGQWFPKLGVFWSTTRGAWNCHQYHATTEFFADFGTFNVTLNVPQRYIVGASGVPIGESGQAPTAPRPSASTAKTSTISPGPPAPIFTPPTASSTPPWAP